MAAIYQIGVTPVQAAGGIPQSCAFEDVGTATAVEILAPDVILADDRRVIRLGGLQFVRFPAHGGGFALDTSAAVKDALRRFVLGRKISLRQSPGLQVKDRYGRIVAHVELPETAGGIWLQRWLVENGWALADPASGEGACAAELLRSEENARRKMAGFWGQGIFRIRDAGAAASLKPMAGTFQIVEGVVKEVSGTSTLYLNFGSNQHSDFTAAITSKYRKLFVPAKLAPESLAGKRVRVRGWIELRNGPYIAIVQPEQIEVLRN